MTDTILAAADRASRAIPPAWPLAASVAVNPFLGQSGESLAQASARLGRAAGVSLTMSRAWYCEKIAAGTISDADLSLALASCDSAWKPANLAVLRAWIAAPESENLPLQTIADLAHAVTGFDWPDFIADRFSAWAAAYLDEGQAVWTAPSGKSAYAAWRAFACHDLSPEIAGLRGFARFVWEAPDDASELLMRAAGRLGVPAEGLESYFHQLLTHLGGWAQFARYRLWQTELGHESDRLIIDFLAIRLIWEEALFAHLEDHILADWDMVRMAHAAELRPASDQIVNAILQEAAERADHRRLGAILDGASGEKASARPALQAAFCIDVRSEPFRRALETLSPDIQTLGFAGFFGLATAHRAFGSDLSEARAPALLVPNLASCAGDKEDEPKDRAKRIKARAKRAWGRFKLAAVASFAFVEASGPLYVYKLLRDSLALGDEARFNDPAPHFDPPLALEQKLKLAQAVLQAMSLTENFAPLVLLLGHGAKVINNPFEAGLHCGACGGYPGDANARLLALLLNDPAVRGGLAEVGIQIPADCLFVGGLHDTTGDQATLFDQDWPSQAHQSMLAEARRWLDAAGALTRAERAMRLPHGKDGKLAARGRDWSEIRPEWGLAGCRALIVGQRDGLRGLDLGGRCFLHDYDWRKDTGFQRLELIMTAPVMVTSWISLQYYGSTVAPTLFGSGNKLLHNVTGGIGVFEGNSGMLRTGLPWQSVHDGENYRHEPLRLAVCIQAPRSAMTQILERHSGLRDLFDHRWLYLFALDDQGRMAARYEPGLSWETIRPEKQIIAA